MNFFEKGIVKGEFFQRIQYNLDGAFHKISDTDSLFKFIK